MPRDRDMEPLITKTEGDNVHPRKVDPNKIVDSFFYLSFCTFPYTLLWGQYFIILSLH